MVRKLILAVVILAMTAVPVPALARDGGHGFHGAPCGPTAGGGGGTWTGGRTRRRGRG